MGILDEYRKRESDRIDNLYKRADCMTEGQIDELIRFTFTTFYEQGITGRAAATGLILKINKALGIRYVPAPGEFDKWHQEFKAMKFELKKSLLVTVANDLCKMNVFTETQILSKIDEFLKDIPGILAGTRDI